MDLACMACLNSHPLVQPPCPGVAVLLLREVLSVRSQVEEEVEEMGRLLEEDLKRTRVGKIHLKNNHSIMRLTSRRRKQSRSMGGSASTNNGTSVSSCQWFRQPDQAGEKREEADPEVPVQQRHGGRGGGEGENPQGWEEERCRGDSKPSDGESLHRGHVTKTRPSEDPGSL